MPYLALDLDARKLCPLVANTCGSTAPEVLWGLTELWQHVWQTESDVVSAVVLAGCVGTRPGLVEALVGFGFLASVEGGFRVRGAERYLRVRRAQREGGKLGRAKSSSKVGTGSTLRSTSGSAQALTPSTEHRAPSTEQEAEEEAPAPPSEAVACGDWESAQDFWNWFQSLRTKAGCVREAEPNSRKLSAFWSEVLMELNGDPEPLRLAVFRFGGDKHWQAATPPCPFAALAREWRKYVPRRIQNVR